MCGICGIFEIDSPVPPKRLRRMTDTLIHRGPDDAGYHFEPGVGLGHRRLSIIDLDTGSQPMAMRTGTFGSSFNGEIYNFPELRAHWKRRAIAFRTRSDTEAIVHLYEEVGEECFAQFAECSQLRFGTDAGGS